MSNNIINTHPNLPADGKAEHSAEPWSWKNCQGAGIQIFAPVPFKANCVEFTLKDGTQPLFGIPDPKYVVAHEIWIQFAPEQWNKMQEANARRIVACVNFCAGVPELGEFPLEQLLRFQERHTSELRAQLSAAQSKADWVDKHGAEALKWLHTIDTSFWDDKEVRAHFFDIRNALRAILAPTAKETL